MSAHAPRFHAFWEHVENRSILTMARADWLALKAQFGQRVEIDVQKTPMAPVASNSSVVGTLLEQRSEMTAEICIIRFDEKDQPTPYNQDKYTVWPDILKHPGLDSMISGASTGLDENFRTFAAENVFIVKQDLGPDHWLPTVPGSATTIVKST